ncbi:hypothetical protein [Aestuariivirga sp.]|uniref:hypothetical protein n=1 Tax=Aestuariivirga sp. TaxID=2650926 RepID=UPI003BAD2C22
MNTRLVGLAAVALLLGGFVLVENFGLPILFSSTSEALETKSEAPLANEAIKFNPLQGLDPQAYAAILERPLFNPGRAPRPPEPVAPPEPVVQEPVVETPPPPPAAPDPGDYKLLGIAEGPNGSAAAIKVSASGEVLYLRKGQPVDAWTIVDIGPRYVQIGTPENPVKFSLFEDANGEAQAEDASGADMAPDMVQPGMPPETEQLDPPMDGNAVPPDPGMQ